MEQNSSPLAESAGPEPQNRPKKAEKVKTFFRWFFNVFFAIVLLAGIYFRAPWKVLALFCIVFLVPSFIPKRHDKKVLYCFLGGGLLILIWILWPVRPLRWKPFAFEDEVQAWQKKYEVPDADNAAVIYRELLAQKDWEAQRDQLAEWDPNSVTMRRPWRAEEFPEVAKYLNENESVIEMLGAAAEYETCWFGFKPDIGDMDSLEVLKDLKTMFGILIRSCNLDLAQGHSDRAMGKLHTAVILSRHLKQQRMFIPFLTGIGIDGKVCAVLKQGILEGSMSREQTIQIQDLYGKTDVSWQQQWPAMMEFEKLTTKKAWASLYEVNEQGQTRLTHSGRGCSWGPCFGGGIHDPNNASYKDRVLGRSRFLISWLFFPSHAEGLSKEIDNVMDPWVQKGLDHEFMMQVSDEMEMPKIEFNFRSILRMLQEILRPAYSSIYKTYLRQQSQVQGTRLCMAIRQYKDQYQVWPSDLEACRPFASSEDIFIDPLIGGAYAYQTEEDGFRLYSRGLNGVDEGGIADRKSGKDDILIWPPEEDGCR